MLLEKIAPKRRASPMVVPWTHFLDSKNQKSQTLSIKISDLRFLNLAVNDRFEPSIIHSAKVFHSTPVQ